MIAAMSLGFAPAAWNVLSAARIISDVIASPVALGVRAFQNTTDVGQKLAAL